MKDLAHWIGADLTVSASGDLAVSEGSEAGVQRVLHQEITPAEGLQRLLAREQKPEYPEDFRG